MNSLATFKAHTPNARIFRAFNTLGWENFADPMFDGIQADLFYCGSDGDAREVIDQLIWECLLRADGSTTNRGLSDSTQGDASVPTLLHTTPAPTRPGILAPKLWWNQGR